MTVEGQGEARSALVVVPDNQLSLAIGKKGQNARLAAKLTGMRIDVKSETELEDQRRRQEEARVRGLAQLEEIPEVGPALAGPLAERGLGSPARIQAAGIEGLRGAGLDEGQAEAILAAVTAWLARQVSEAAAAEAAAKSAAAEGEAALSGEDPTS